MKGDNNKSGAPQIQDLFVDIGVSSRKAAEKLIRVGDPITLNDQFEVLRGDKVVARAFDNRVGTFAVAETLRLLSSQRSKLKCEVCFVSNTMEEIGCLGARQIAYSLNPDVALIVDVTHATDYPTVNKQIHGDIKVGDILATPVTGAYGHSMGSNYNKVLRPPVVFVRDGDARLVVRRETFDDLTRLDV